MTRFQRLEELFLAASELPVERHGEFLERQESDPELRREVLELLGHSPGAEQRLGAAIDAGLGWVGSEPDRPERLGPYRVLGELGRGGLGVVFLAEREDQFRIRVAIKVVRPGMGHKGLERRLQRERQILAGLEHPHIARILDGGTTDQGAPFLVMELVHGRPITEFCRERELAIPERLELFRKVCDAVHYAHRSLVLHRDLKPSNILVSDEGVPKLLDFGIAKMLEAPDEPWLDEATTATLTGPGVRLLTPEYASPEQVLGRPLTTSSDVYSLGVLLHELLTDDRPYRFDRHRPSQIENVVCERKPQRPSISYHQRSGKKAPWDADLDNIVGMALRKEVERRYASALQLSDDLYNYLHDLPVVAQADSLTYRMRKFVRRHRIAVLAASIVLLTLLSAVVVTTYQAGVAERERRRAEESLVIAEQERQKAETVADFMVDIFEVSDPSRSLGARITAREVLDQGARRIAWQLRDRPGLRTTMMTTMGRVYRKLDLYQDAETLLEEAMAQHSTNRQGVAPGAEEIEGLRELALLRWDQGHLREAERMLRSSVALAEAQQGTTSSVYADHLMDLGLVLQAGGALAEAEQVMLQTLDIRMGSGSDEQVAEARDYLAELYYEKGDYVRAEALCRQALEDRRKLFGENHPDVAKSLNNLAAIRLEQADGEEAVALLEAALSLRRRLYGDVHSSVAQILKNLALVKVGLRQYDEAEPLLVEAVDVLQKIYGEDHPEPAEALYSLGFLHQARGDLGAAEELLSRVLDIRRRALGERHPKVVHSLFALAKLYKSSDPVRAEALFRETIELQRLTLSEDDHRRSYALMGLGQILLTRGAAGEAERFFRQAHNLRANALPADHWETALARAHLGRSLVLSGRAEDGRQHLESALAVIKERLGDEHAWTRELTKWLRDVAEPG